MSLEGLKAMRDVTAPIRGTTTAVRVSWDDLANLIAVAEAAREFEGAVSLNMIAGGRVAPIEQAIRLLEGVRLAHSKLRSALDVLDKAG